MTINDVENVFKAALASMGISDVPIIVSIPDALDHGDYTTPVALRLASRLGKRPREIAEQLRDVIVQMKTNAQNQEESEKEDQNISKKYQTDTVQQEVLRSIAHIEVAGAGHINLWKSEASISNQLFRVITHGYIVRIGKTSVPSIWNQAEPAERVITEFTDPNPFKEFHIGHLYSNSVGESLSRLLEAQGHMVRRVCYQGDVGLHVAKSVWGMWHGIQNEIRDTCTGIDCLRKYISDLEDLPIERRVAWLGTCYAAGTVAYEKNATEKQTIDTLNATCFGAARTMHERIKHEGSDVHEQRWTIDYELLFDSLLKTIAAEGGVIAPLTLTNTALVQVLYEVGRSWSLQYFDTIFQRRFLDINFLKAPQ
jgi:arginyl-tRNA synthetase